jgi:uncharacterized protein (TIGR02217 family)
MSNAIFPEFPGLSWGVTKIPTWSTRVQSATSGKELRAAYYSRPIWKFQLSYEVLRADAAHAEYQSLVSFFNLRMGSFESFLYKDPDNNYVTAQPIGIGDGHTVTFPLLHTIGAFTEPIGYSNQAIIYANGAQVMTGVMFTPDGTGVTFATAPAAGVAITWSGFYYYRVRFAKDSNEFEQFMKDFWTSKKVELTGVI